MQILHGHHVVVLYFTKGHLNSISILVAFGHMMFIPSLLQTHQLVQKLLLENMLLKIRNAG
jgi:hypothetical protein